MKSTGKKYVWKNVVKMHLLITCKEIWILLSTMKQIYMTLLAWHMLWRCLAPWKSGRVMDLRFYLKSLKICLIFLLSDWLKKFKKCLKLTYQKPDYFQTGLKIETVSCRVVKINSNEILRVFTTFDIDRCVLTCRNLETNCQHSRITADNQDNSQRLLKWFWPWVFMWNCFILTQRNKSNLVHITIWFK